ncbi:MAG: hypothetical protein Q9211_006228 [Gyalolechia sp. 1 TL-2023]
MDRSSIASKIGSSTEPERRNSSRQAVADRSRVSTPVFKPQIVGNPRRTLQQSRVPLENTLATRTMGIDGRSTQRHSQPESKTLGAFDTDTEKLDDTSLDALDSSVSFTVKSEAAPEDRGRSSGNFLVPRTHKAVPQLRSEVSSHAPASCASEDFAETNADLSDDDESDNPNQYDDFDPNDRRDPANIRHEGATFPLNGKGKTNEVKLHQEQFSRVLGQDFVKSEFEGQSQSYPHHISSTGPPSVSADETKSEMENAGALGSPSPNRHSLTRHVKVEVPANPITDNSRRGTGDSYYGIPATKRKHSPRPTPDIQSPDACPHLSNNQKGYNIPQSLNRDQSATSAKAQKDLDYEPKALAEMSYRQLADESFDASPRPIELNDPSLTDRSSLTEKLLYLHRLTGPQERTLSHRQAFFSSLPIAQYEECGDLMADQFSGIITRFKEARQETRRLAKEFEDEVAAREKVVESRKVAVTNDLSRLRRAGQDVVRR